MTAEERELKREQLYEELINTAIEHQKFVDKVLEEIYFYFKKSNEENTKEEIKNV